MSLVNKNVSPAAGGPAQARESRGYSGKGPRLMGLLLVVAGLLLMWPAVADALSAGSVDARGSGAGETLRGASRGEELVAFGGADELYGGPGRDALLAGAGDDFVESGDGERDLVLRGKGDDTVSADSADLVSRDCETVYAD